MGPVGRPPAVSILLVLVYGFVAIGGQALHALSPCDSCAHAFVDVRDSCCDEHHHDGVCDRDHDHQSGLPEDDSSPEDGKRPHDPSHCAICQWCAQGQLIPAPVALQVSGHLVKQPVCQPPAAIVVRAEMPPDVRGPPLGI